MRLKSVLRGLALSGALLFVLIPPVSARGRGGARGAVFVGSGFGWYDPFWDPFFYSPMPYYSASTGTVKFETSNKDAAVFIDGGYAGTVGKLKNLQLRPGSYNIELRTAGTQPYAQRVYVAAGKTVKVNPNLNVPSQQ